MQLLTPSELLAVGIDWQGSGGFLMPRVNAGCEWASCPRVGALASSGAGGRSMQLRDAWKFMNPRGLLLAREVGDG